MLRLYSSGRRPAKGRLSLVKRLSTGNFLTGPRQPFLGAVAKLGGEPQKLSFSFPDGRCVWAFSGRLEDPVDDHRVRVRLPVGKHRALPFPQ